MHEGREAFGYDGDKFELEDFAAENCEYVGSVRGEEGGWKETGKRPSSGD